MAEANRHNNVSSYLNKGGKPGGQNDNKGGGQNDKKDDDCEGFQKRRTNFVAGLWGDAAGSHNMIITEETVKARV